MKKMFVLSILEVPEMVADDKNKLYDKIETLLKEDWDDDTINEIIESLKEYGEYSFADDEPITYMITAVDII